MIKMSILPTMCAALTICLAPAAFAGAWGEFEARCLAPLESEQKPIVADLDRDPSHDIAKSVAYEIDGGVLYTEANDGGRVWGCSVSRLQVDELGEAKAGMATRLEAGQYEISQAGGNVRLLSTDWRKPKLRVDLTLLVSDTILIARDVR